MCEVLCIYVIVTNVVVTCINVNRSIEFLLF